MFIVSPEFYTETIAMMKGALILGGLTEDEASFAITTLIMGAADFIKRSSLKQPAVDPIFTCDDNKTK